ncbi:MAG: cytidylate kinase family protein, partial [Clostridia bacterium]|nr:cytidylate kinase family protein [Clostridia bacterium]
NIVVGIALGGQPIISYNVGANKPERVKKMYMLIILAELVIIGIFTILNEAYPDMFIAIFGSTDEVLYMEYARYVFRIFLSLVIVTCFIKVTSIFFQAAGKPVQAMICSLTRDIVVFVPAVIIIPLAYEASHAGKGILALLFAAPLADLVCGIVTVVLVILYFKTKQQPRIQDQDYLESENSDFSEKFEPQESTPGFVITIAREHGTRGKQIGEELAKRLGIPCYNKEIIALVAKNSGLTEENITSSNLYLSKDIFEETYNAQKEVINKIVQKGSSVIVGRAASHFVEDKSNLISVFIYADMETKIKNVMEMYGDTRESAIKNIKQSDASRAKYFNTITSKSWDKMQDYDICINASYGVAEAVDALYAFVTMRTQSIEK